jgi:YD repeat-containing protein
LPAVVLVLLCTLSSTSALASPPSNAFRFFHDPDGRLSAAIDPEGSTAVYNWDAAGNLLSISRHASSQLSIVQLSPARGEVGSTVMIEGTGFSTTPGSNTVKFNGTATTVTAASATSLTVKVPSGATSGSVTVAVGEEGPVTSPQQRKNGKLQVTYAGHPLYYYVDDSPGTILCHDVAEFGGVWLVVKPDGEPA